MQSVASEYELEPATDIFILPEIEEPTYFFASNFVVLPDDRDLKSDIVHELLHATFPELSESEVEEITMCLEDDEDDEVEDGAQFCL